MVTLKNEKKKKLFLGQTIKGEGEKGGDWKKKGGRTSWLIGKRGGGGIPIKWGPCPLTQPREKKTLQGGGVKHTQPGKR